MGRHMHLWLIPMFYMAASILCGLILPRLEHEYLAAYTISVSAPSALAFLSAAASGILVLAGIVFSLAFVMVQFSAIAYSPRLVAWHARDPVMFHSLGVFFAAFSYSLATLAWVDRGGSGTVPLFSSVLVIVLLVASLLLFSRMVQRLGDLQITSVLNLVGDRGRVVIRSMFDRLSAGSERPRASALVDPEQLGPVTQTVVYAGEPRVVARFDIASLVRQAREARAVVEMACGVGDTLVQGTMVLRVHGAKRTLPERDLMRGVRLARERTFEQDPKYPIRILVDIAIKALSPAINDPTTAVQALDQIEDLLHRIARRDLDAGFANDADGVLRLVFPMPTWEDYLTLAFDEIRQYGTGSLQVMRRLRSALTGVAGTTIDEDRREVVRRYQGHLDDVINRSGLDAQDRATAFQEDLQGLGLSRKPAAGADMPHSSVAGRD